MVQQSAYPGDDEMTVFIACVAIAWSRILFVYMLDSFYRMCYQLKLCDARTNNIGTTTQTHILVTPQGGRNLPL